MEQAKEPKHSHWAEQIAEDAVASKKPPFVIASGITTSGPTHLGTLCEFLFPSAVHEFLSRTHPSKFYFVADILDAFDSVPSAMARHAAFLEPHLGKPLAHVPDPEKCHESLGEHFLSDALGIMKSFDVKPQILRATELYAQGKYDSYAVLFLREIENVKQIVAHTSLKKDLSEWWSPIMPVCKNCGKIATTRVTGFKVEGEDASFSYACDRADVKYTKGCGFKGSSKISSHEYKVVWRLDWPSRQDFLGVSAEGAGVDHMTRGGSWDTARAIHEQVFKKQPPIAFKFGFILFKGKKYSKSKGAGLGVEDLLSLVPPELIKYALFRPDIQENIDFDPNGYKLLSLYDEFAQASKLDLGQQLSRADRKRAIAFSLSTRKMRWSAFFSDLLLYYQIYLDWDKVAEKLEDKEGVKYLAGYIQNWVKEGYAPEDYSFSFSPKKPENEKLALSFAKALEKNMNAIDIHNLVFRSAEANQLQASEAFRTLYRALISKDKGPKFGRMVEALGVEKVKQTLLGMCGETP